MTGRILRLWLILLVGLSLGGSPAFGQDRGHGSRIRPNPMTAQDRDRDRDRDRDKN